jgi:hypothetical protein
MAHNFVRDWREFEHLVELPCLEDLVRMNPLLKLRSFKDESITEDKNN